MTSGRAAPTGFWSQHAIRARASLLSILFLFAACAHQPSGEARPTPAQFDDLPGWQDSDPRPALAAYRQACKQAEPACAALSEISFADAANAREFVQTHFQPEAIADSQTGSEGLFTGYYEPELNGSLTRHGAYQTPLYAKPKDLISVDLGAFKPDWQGQHISGRVEDGKLVPYYDRAAIDAGALSNDSVVAYVDDPVEAFFLEVQGSGQIDLEGGTHFIARYDAGNGQPYTAIGKTLIASGEFAPGTANANAIKAWLRAHPGQARQVMESNAGVVFFRRDPKDASDAPVGASGRALTPLVSLAVDAKTMPLGTLLWLDTQTLRSLMLADDTGGAIKGVVRGDIYFGPGAEAAQNAGTMQSRGRYWALQPLRAP